MLDATKVYPIGGSEPPTEQGEKFEPYHCEEGPFAFCWTCHGFLVGPPGRRLCGCHEPTPLPPALVEKARVLDGIRDALAESFRRRWFRLLIPLIGDAAESEARAAWEALWPVARERAARRLREKGLTP